MDFPDRERPSVDTGRITIKDLISPRTIFVLHCNARELTVENSAERLKANEFEQSNSMGEAVKSYHELIDILLKKRRKGYCDFDAGGVENIVCATSHIADGEAVLSKLANGNMPYDNIRRRNRGLDQADFTRGLTFEVAVAKLCLDLFEVEGPLGLFIQKGKELSVNDQDLLVKKLEAVTQKISELEVSEATVGMLKPKHQESAIRFKKFAEDKIKTALLHIKQGQFLEGLIELQKVALALADIGSLTGFGISREDIENFGEASTSKLIRHEAGQR